MPVFIYRRKRSTTNERAISIYIYIYIYILYILRRVDLADPANRESTVFHIYYYLIVATVQTMRSIECLRDSRSVGTGRPWFLSPQNSGLGSASINAIIIAVIAIRLTGEKEEYIYISTTNNKRDTILDRRPTLWMSITTHFPN
jgi:hypothetical protein